MSGSIETSRNSKMIRNHTQRVGSAKVNLKGCIKEAKQVLKPVDRID